MDNQQIQNLATPEEIWAILREVSKKQDKSSEETDRWMKEGREQVEEIRKQMKDTDRRLKKTVDSKAHIPYYLWQHQKATNQTER